MTVCKNVHIERRFHEARVQSFEPSQALGVYRDPREVGLPRYLLCCLISRCMACDLRILVSDPNKVSR